MIDQHTAQMGQTFFTSNTLVNATKYENHNFGTAHQSNKAPRPQQNVDTQRQPSPIRRTQDFYHHQPGNQFQLQPQLQSQPRFRPYPPPMYMNQNRVAHGPAPTTYLHQPCMTSYPPYDYPIPPQAQPVAAAFHAPVMQAQLPALPEGVKHWLAAHSQEEIQALIMQHFPPAPFMVQSQIQATGYDQHFDQGIVHQVPSEGTIKGNSNSVRPTKRKAVDSDGAARKKRIRPDDDPGFQRVVQDGEIKFQCLKEQCAKICLKEGSVHEHKGSNKHQNRSNRLLCPGCGHYFSRGDGLKRHAESEQCAKNQEKSKISAQTSCAVAPANLAASTFVVQPSVSVPQGQFTFKGTRPATQQAPRPSVIGPNFSPGPAAQPVVDAPGLNSMTQKVTPFPVFAQNSLSLPDLRSSVQVPHQPSGVLPIPITAQEGEGDTDLFGSPVSLALPDHGYSALGAGVHTPSTSQFDAPEPESYWDWCKRLEQPIQGDLALIY
ncbi:hypothetical protein EDB19DRAFT_1945659 [Suillus lakei]|nr:hypothetical protein EDB19DRAFT_1945659 [Suillus lakei]